MKNKKKSKWQIKREKQASQNSQFDPKIHQLGREGFVAYCMGNVIKYTSRWGFKNGVKDLEKAQVYLNWSIQEMQDEAIRTQENGES